MENNIFNKAQPVTLKIIKSWKPEVYRENKKGYPHV